MYQDHLHKVTQDSEHQRQKRDEMIKNLKIQLTKTEGELQNTRAQLVADKYVLNSVTLGYACQVSRLSLACGLKTSISRQLTLTDHFLTTG